MAEKLLASLYDTKEWARLEVLVARDVYGLDAAGWQHLTGSFSLIADCFMTRSTASRS